VDDVLADQFADDPDAFVVIAGRGLYRGKRRTAPSFWRRRAAGDGAPA
jgi:hypothetical protein